MAVLSATARRPWNGRFLAHRPLCAISSACRSPASCRLQPHWFFCSRTCPMVVIGQPPYLIVFLGMAASVLAGLWLAEKLRSGAARLGNRPLGPDQRDHSFDRQSGDPDRAWRGGHAPGRLRGVLQGTLSRRRSACVWRQELSTQGPGRDRAFCAVFADRLCGAQSSGGCAPQSWRDLRDLLLCAEGHRSGSGGGAPLSWVPGRHCR